MSSVSVPRVLRAPSQKDSFILSPAHKYAHPENWKPWHCSICILPTELGYESRRLLSTCLPSGQGMLLTAHSSSGHCLRPPHLGLSGISHEMQIGASVSESHGLMNECMVNCLSTHLLMPSACLVKCTRMCIYKSREQAIGQGLNIL